ncbi:MAG: hypothetical protein ACOYEC_05190 [Christensenellales bacterium]|jgi:predicted KAP-like P-loop ATPase|nr:hypothetical protein [Clostridiales bacterium]
MRKITVKEAVEKIEGKFIWEGDAEKTIENGYCGDFLSHVISRIPDNAIWFTIMNNANVAAVAKLAEAVAVVICEGTKADARLIECCKNEDIILIETNLTSFECAERLGRA